MNDHTGTGRLEVVQVDAFTTTAYSGNPCAVVLDADGLDEAVMQTIAREMNLRGDGPDGAGGYAVEVMRGEIVVPDGNNSSA